MVEPTFLGKLLHSKDPRADSLVLYSGLSLIAVIAFQGLDLILLRNAFNVWVFSAACMTIVGGLGCSKAVRDKFSPSPNEPPSEPKP